MALRGFWEVSFTAVVGDVVMVVFLGQGDVSVRRIRSTLKRTGVQSIFWVGRDFPPMELTEKLSDYTHYAGVWNPTFSPDKRFVACYALLTGPLDVHRLKGMG